MDGVFSLSSYFYFSCFVFYYVCVSRVCSCVFYYCVCWCYVFLECLFDKRKTVDWFDSIGQWMVPECVGENSENIDRLKVSDFFGCYHTHGPNAQGAVPFIPSEYA